MTCQVRNCDHIQIELADLLSAKERNLILDAYGDSNVTLNPGPATVSLATTRFNMSSNLYEITSNQLAIHYKGIYSFHYGVTIGHNAGSDAAVVYAFLEVDKGAGFVEVASSRTYINNIATTELASGSRSLVQNITEVDWLYRLRAIRTSGADSLYAQGANSYLQVMCIAITQQ